MNNSDKKNILNKEVRPKLKIKKRRGKNSDLPSYYRDRAASIASGSGGRAKWVFDRKYSFVVFALTFIAAVALRTYELYSNMNFQTGKYIDESFSKRYSAITVIAGMALIILIMALGRSKDKAVKSCVLINPMRLRFDRLTKKISVTAAYGSLTMSLLIIFQLITKLSAFFGDISVRVQEERAVAADMAEILATYHLWFTEIPLMQWIIFIMMAIMTVTFILTAVNIFKGDGITKGNCFFLSGFAVWKLFEIFAMISDNHMIGAYSQDVYIMLTAMTSAAFFLYTVRLFSGFEKKFTRFWMCVYGYAASILAGVSTLPRYITMVIVSYDDHAGMASPDYPDVGIIWVTVSILAVFWGKYSYRVMPKLNINGKRRWIYRPGLNSGAMKNIEEGKRKD